MNEISKQEKTTKDVSETEVIPLDVLLIPSYRETFETLRRRKEETGRFSIEAPIEWHMMKMAMELGMSEVKLQEETGCSLEVARTVKLTPLNEFNKSLLRREIQEAVFRALEINKKAEEVVINKLKNEPASRASVIAKDAVSRAVDFLKLGQKEEDPDKNAINVYVNLPTEELERRFSRLISSRRERGSEK